jgi:hypothetical protein
MVLDLLDDVLDLFLGRIRLDDDDHRGPFTKIIYRGGRGGESCNIPKGFRNKTA